MYMYMYILYIHLHVHMHMHVQIIQILIRDIDAYVHVHAGPRRPCMRAYVYAHAERNIIEINETCELLKSIAKCIYIWPWGLIVNNVNVAS